MTSARDFKNTPITVSQVNRETEQGKGIWELKDWRKDFEILRTTSSCLIKVGTDQRHGVRLFFGDINGCVHGTEESYMDTDSFVPLWVELQMCGYNSAVIDSDSQVTVTIDVHELSDNLEWKNTFASGFVTFKVGDKPKAEVFDQFLKYSHIDYRTLKPDSFRFGINVSISPIKEPPSTIVLFTP